MITIITSKSDKMESVSGRKENIVEDVALLLENGAENLRSVGEGTSRIDVVVSPFDIKQEYDIRDFHSGEHGDLKSEINVKNVSIEPGCSGLLSDTKFTVGGTSSIDVLGVKQESYMCDFHGDENDDFKCEEDIKNFSLDIVRPEDVMVSGTFSDKFNVDSKNSINQIQEMNHDDYSAHDQTQGHFVCDLNDSKLISKDTLQDRVDYKEHITEIHSEIKKFKCDFCEYGTMKKKDLQRHIDGVHLKLKKFKCHLCEYGTGYTRDLQRHIDGIHLKLKKFKCDVCEHSSVDEYNLKRHITQVHLKLKKFKCHLCEYATVCNSNLDRHIDATHLELKKFKCHFCEHTSADEHNLKRHITRVHLKLKKFKCHLCEYSSANKHDLQRHIDGIHLKLKKFKCEFCEYSTADEGNLRKHNKKRHAMH